MKSVRGNSAPLVPRRNSVNDSNPHPLEGLVVRFFFPKYQKWFGHADPGGFLHIFRASNEFTFESIWKLCAGPEANVYFLQNRWNYVRTWIGWDEENKKLTLRNTKSGRYPFRFVLIKKDVYYLQSYLKKEKWIGVKNSEIILGSKKYRLTFEMTTFAINRLSITESLMISNPSHPLEATSVKIQNQWELNIDWLGESKTFQIQFGCSVHDGVLWNIHAAPNRSTYYIEHSETKKWIGLDENKKLLTSNNDESSRIAFEFFFLGDDAYAMKDTSASDSDNSWIGYQGWDHAVKNGYSIQFRVPFKLHFEGLTLQGKSARK